MTEEGAELRNIADTARWAAVFRARETEREDASFSDPYAARLAGTRGQEIAAAFPFHNQQAWSWVTRTWLFDQLVAQAVAAGTDMIVNLAAGLDARPLPPSLLWVEADFQDLLQYKQQVLLDVSPVCRLERIPA